MLLIIAGASASGKTEISRRLLKNKNFKEVVSYTTRAPRPGEINGKDYHFVSQYEFSKMVLQEKFAEYEQYPGDRWYGTSLEDVKKVADSEEVYVMVLTPSGMRNIKKHVSDENVITVLVECDLQERVKRYVGRLNGEFTLDDLDEITRRAHRDFGMLMGVKNEVDHVFDNTKDGEVENIVDNIIGICKEKWIDIELER